MTTTRASSVPIVTAEDVRLALRARHEIALLDVREEGALRRGAPAVCGVAAARSPRADVLDRIPRPTTPIVVYDAGEGLAADAVETLRALGYTTCRQLDGGLDGWRRDGGEIFRDVNSREQGVRRAGRGHAPHPVHCRPTT